MKCFFSFFLLFPFLGFSQFDFNLNYDIAVIKNNVQDKYPWAGGLNAPQYSNIDLNFDGVQDLFIFDRSANKVLTFIQNGIAGQMDFLYSPAYESDFPNLTGWALLVDYDGDGKKDIFSYNASSAIVYKNTGSQNNGLSFVVETLSLPATFLMGGNTLHSNAFCSSIDIPAISDIDNDGDLDVLSFGNSITSSCVTYYRNLSQELYGNNNVLEFKASSVCYGNFRENSSSNMMELNECCFNQVDNPEIVIDIRPGEVTGDRHSGSTILSIDLDADGMEDLIIGDNGTANLVRLMNNASVPNTDIDMISPDYAFPSYDVPADVDVFPGAFYVDLNNDNIRDLVVAPNTSLLSNDFRANWFYKNIGLDNNPNFSLQTKGFLQDDMIDGGSRSYPVYFDHNGDGLKDLILSVGGRYDSVSTNSYSQMFYYENTGTLNTPEFTLVDEDYGSFSNFLGLPHSLYIPAFGDADGDGDDDLLLSDLNDTMYYFENVSGPGSIAQFVNPIPFKNNLGQVIDEGTDMTPKFVDLNRDGKVDLVIGKKNGKIAYYENQGSALSYSFVFKTDELGGVNVADYTTIGMASPEFVDVEGVYHLICGSKLGFLYYYSNIDSNLTGNFNLVDSMLQDIYVGAYSTCAILDVDADNRLEMLIGNNRGGLVLYESAEVTSVGLGHVALEVIKVYPNPAKTNVYIDLSKLQIGSFNNAKYMIHDIVGRQIGSGVIKQTITALNCNSFSKGVYFLTINIEGQQITRRIILE